MKISRTQESGAGLRANVPGETKERKRSAASKISIGKGSYILSIDQIGDHKFIGLKLSLFYFPFETFCFSPKLTILVEFQPFENHLIA